MSSYRFVKTFKGQLYWRTLIKLRNLDVSSPSKRVTSTYLPENTSVGGFYSSIQNNKIVPRHHLYSTYRNFVANADSDAGKGNTSEPPPETPRNWKRWVLGIFMSIIIPSFTHKLGILGVWKDEFDTRLQEIEDAVEEGEKVATAVEKVAEKWLDSLPDGLLKNVLTTMEKGAGRASNLFNKLDAAIDEFQEEEKTIVEKWVESAETRAKVREEELSK